MHNGGEGPEVIQHVVGDLMVFVTFGVIGLAVLLVWWGFSGGLWRWDQERRARREEEREAEEEAERIPAWDAQRAAELEEWIRSGYLPTPLSRLYPAYQEFTWEWARLQALGYELDHDPVQLDDGQLMVTYSLAAVIAAASEEPEPEDVFGRPYVVRQLPSPPR
jgi:hypothetical protein